MSGGGDRERSGGGGDRRGSASAMPSWKAQSIAFRQAMKAARQISQVEAKSKATGIPLHVLLKDVPPPSYHSGGGGVGGSDFNAGPDPSYLQCPTCGRSFNQKAGERHIPQVRKSQLRRN